MSTPVGHALAGIAVGKTMSNGRPFWGPGKDFALFALLAQAPDLDFIPGLLSGQVDAWHHGISHSLGSCLVVGALTALLGLKSGNAARWGLMGFFICLSHVFLDALNLDTSYPHGVPLLWPASSEYILIHPLYPDVWRNPPWGPTIVHNLWCVFLELATLGPLAWISARRDKKLRRT